MFQVLYLGLIMELEGFTTSCCREAVLAAILLDRDSIKRF